VTGGLHDLLDELLLSGSDTNPALNALLRDYTRYHVVFIAVGGLFLLAFVVLAVSSWRRWRRAPRPTNRRWSFERVTYACFGASSVLLALMMAVIVAANISNVVDPRHGFSGAVDMVGAPRTGTRTAELHQAFTAWLQSGRTDMPSLIDTRIDERLAWQRPKAIICSVLLLALVLLSARIWRTLVRRSRARQSGWERKDVALLLAGVAAGPVCLLVMVMVIGNTQGSFAPMSLTLFFG